MLLGNPLSPGGKTGVKGPYLPAPQSVQDVAPVDAEYLPAAQLVHSAEPVAALYVAAKQAVHATPSGPVCPRAQRQAETTVCPVADVTEFAGQVEHDVSAEAPVDAEYLPEPQSVHTAEPVAALYFPATHAVHVPPLVPVCPRAQRQAETAVCPVADVTEFAGQLEH